MPADSLIHRLPRHLKMSELRVFVAVLEHRSFHKAAAAVHLTQPAVTKAIAGLEEMLGVKLFDRHAHGVVPTAHGLSFAPRAVAVFEELRRAAQDLALVSSGARGTLRIGTVPMPAIPFLPIAIRELTAAQPDAFVSVVEARESELVERLRKRDIELAILRLALFDLDDDLHADTLFDEKLCVVASKDHAFVARKTLSWPEMLCERWVLPPADCYFFEYVLRTLDRAGLALPRKSVESFEVSVQYGMVSQGGMLSFGMRSPHVFAPGKEQVVRLPFELPAPERPVSAISLGAQQPSPLAQMLVGQVRALVAAATRADSAQRSGTPGRVRAAAQERPTRDAKGRRARL
jgi:DNA-binding transcriptional LysR family regulator